jgi:hypothetical protein
MIHLILRQKIIPFVESNNLARINSSKRYAEVDFIVPQLNNKNFSLRKNFKNINETTLVGRLGLCRSFEVMAFCKTSELSKSSKFFEGSIIVSQYENYVEIPSVSDGDIVNFVVLNNNLFILEIKYSPASFAELRNQFCFNQDTTLRILDPYFIKQKYYQQNLGGSGVSINSINTSSYSNSVYEEFLKIYRSSDGNVAHDLMYKSVSELIIIRRKSQTQIRKDNESFID